MEAPETPAIRLRAKLEGIIHNAPLMSIENSIVLAVLIENNPILQQALGTLMHYATQKALALRNFNIAQPYGAEQFAKEQGFALGIEAAVTTLLNMIQESQEKIDEKTAISASAE